LNNNLKFKLLHPNAIAPRRAHQEEDLGYDLYAIEPIALLVGVTLKARTGVAVQFPKGWGALVLVRSSQGDRGLHSTSQVIDPGYRGEFHVVIHNSGPLAVHYAAGERIGQLVPIPQFPGGSEVVTEFDDQTDRGTAGFGSTGS
jgi:dUTP pyrophosphatase